MIYTPRLKTDPSEGTNVRLQPRENSIGLVKNIRDDAVWWARHVYKQVLCGSKERVNLSSTFTEIQNKWRNSSHEIHRDVGQTELESRSSFSLHWNIRPEDWAQVVPGTLSPVILASSFPSFAGVSRCYWTDFKCSLHAFPLSNIGMNNTLLPKFHWKGQRFENPNNLLNLFPSI